MKAPRFSVVIPVYNRPQEVQELLESLTRQSWRDFEVILVEDGSCERCDEVAQRYSAKLRIRYFFKANEGPGPARNYGYSQAVGEYFVVFDSDCIVPPHYFDTVDAAIRESGWEAWGGPDRPHQDFTPLQRAMGYTMSSVLTTGGIRGGKKRLGWFQPRSFNMGISRKVFESTGGFCFDRFAEDIEFSIRMRNAGFKVGLIPDAYVYHKRRTSFSGFYDQVFNFGKGRVLVGRKHPGEVKITHWFPAIFVIAVSSLLVLPFLYVPLFFAGLGLLLFYLFAILLHSLYVNRDLTVALLSVPAAWLQLWGYGLGFLKEYASKRSVS